MKPKTQKRREALERLRRHEASAVTDLSKAERDLHLPIDLSRFAFGTKEWIRESRANYLSGCKRTLERIRGEIAHLETLKLY